MHKQAHTANSPDRIEQSLGVARRLRVSLRSSSLRCTLFGFLALLLALSAAAEKNYSPEVTDTEIKIGQNMPYSRPAKLADPKNFPWTVMWQIPFDDETYLVAQYILANLRAAKVGVLYQNDEFGKSMLPGLHEGFGAARTRMIVAEMPQEVSDPTVDSQIVTLQASGADTLITLAGPKW